MAKVLAFLPHDFDFPGEVADGPGSALVGAYLEGIIVLEFEETGDVLEDFGDFGILQGFTPPSVPPTRGGRERNWIPASAGMTI